MRKLLFLILLLALPTYAQDAATKAIERLEESTDRSFEDTLRSADDVLWHFRLGDVANIDKYEIATSKPRREKNPTDQNAGNPMILPVYVFAPKNVKGRVPLVVFAHGGVHGRTTISYAHIFRELLEQGYIVISPEYRGSIGHGGDIHDQIDYGGAEVDDVHDARNWAVEMLPNVDPKRVAVIGWSHGGFQALMNIFNWPNDYQVAYAGVPVSDLVQRMGYKSESYHELFAEHIGKRASENVMEYRKRSPVYHAHKLATPLLVHSTTNDEDVNVLEVEHLIAALKASGKKFEYKIYENAPGAHRFNRIDTKLAKESRAEIWAFLAKYLK